MAVPENKIVRRGSFFLGAALVLLGAIAQLIFPAHAWAPAVRWAGLAVLLLSGIGTWSLTGWIFFSLLLGGELGLARPQFAEHLRVLSDIFLRLFKVIVAPLIFGTLVTGIAAHGDLRSVGRIGIKSLIYFEVVTTLALFIGLAAINVSRAGEGLAVTPTQSAQPQPSAAPLRWDEFLLHIFPENIAKAVAENQVLQVVVFALLFGIALARVPEAKQRAMLNFCESLTQTMFSFTNLVMYYAPVGVGAAMAYTVGHMGISVLLPLAKLLITGYAALIAFALLVLLPVSWLARLPVARFIKAVAEPAAIAFATSASEAALPRAMESMEAFGVPRRIVSFVIPLGYGFNLDGSTLYLSLASMFVAQAAGIHMSWTQQLFMLFALMLTSKGIAGVPRAVPMVLLATAAMFQLPTDLIFLILGIDALMDMARTATNVVGNCLASAVIARWEGELVTTRTEELSLAPN